MKKYAHIIVILLVALIAVLYFKIIRAKIEEEIVKNKYVTMGYVFDQKYGARNVSIVYKYRFKTDTIIASYPVEKAAKYMHKTYVVHCDSLNPDNHIIFLESLVEIHPKEPGRIHDGRN
ncbi:MAG: hypothetical protein AAF554_17060 [Bacteroidota bacterium]